MSRSLFDLTGKTAVITGGGGVLGSSIALSLAAAGVRVAMLGRTAQKLAAVFQEIERGGGAAIAVVADVLEEKQLVGARERILDAWERIDILVNAAGGNQIRATVGLDESFFELGANALDDVVDLNLKGTTLPTQVFGKPMAARERGSIINISSMAASRVLTRVVGYSMAKAGVENFTRWLAVETAQRFGTGIRVNAIAPGFFLTEQNRALLTNEDGTPTKRCQAIVAHTPAGRLGEPEDLWSTVHWLCADASQFVTGVVIPVDGGFGAYGGV